MLLLCCMSSSPFPNKNERMHIAFPLGHLRLGIEKLKIPSWESIYFFFYSFSTLSDVLLFFFFHITQEGFGSFPCDSQVLTRMWISWYYPSFVFSTSLFLPSCCNFSIYMLFHFSQAVCLEPWILSDLFREPSTYLVSTGINFPFYCSSFEIMTIRF